MLFQRFQKGEQRGGVMPGFGVEQVVRVAANFFDQVVVVAAGEHFLAEGVVINVFAEVGDAQFFTERIEVELEVVEAVQRLVVEGGAVLVHEVVGHGCSLWYCGLCLCTASIIAAACSGGMSGVMPWPRLKMWRWPWP